MSIADIKLKAIADQLKQGVVPPKETVRSFLRWFGAERRGFNVVQGIRQQLKKHGIVTFPDFDFEYIDNYIGFKHAPAENGASGIEFSAAGTDPTYRLGRLDSANKAPLSVKPDANIQQVITVMMTHDYSQVPVMTSPREVKGIVSWKAIGRRLALKLPCAAIRDCMEPAEIVSIDASLFSAIDTVAIHDYVLVQANDKTICGIVTASDFNDQFRRLAEPFLLVGEVENGVRRMLRNKFTVKELEEVKAPGDDERAIGAVSDLTFGEYGRLIESENAGRSSILK